MRRNFVDRHLHMCQMEKCTGTVLGIENKEAQADSREGEWTDDTDIPSSAVV
jgi:hypothetical protein